MCFLQIGLLAQTNETDKLISIFPNPVQGKSTMSFYTKLDGFTQINVYGIDGKMIISTGEYLQAGKNSFSLSLPKGVFILKVNGIEYSTSVKVISNTSSEINPMLVHKGIENSTPVISNSNGIMRVTTALTTPVLTTMGAVSVGPMFIVSGGNITSDGGSPVTERGICWNTTPNSTVSNNKNSSGSGVGNFYISTTSNLLSLTTYYIRPYAINIIGVAYGNEISVMTINGSSSYSCPTVNTVQLMNYGNSIATINGNVTSQGGPPVIERGVCWSTHPITTLADSKNASGSGLGLFYATAFNLNENTTYYIRAYATNQVATTYGSELSFRTSGAKIGDSYNGGIIAYFYQPGDDGYQDNARCGIMVTSSNLGSVIWSIDANELIGAQRTGLGTAGLENTSQIVYSQGSGNYAAFLCQSSGWYLPTIVEMNKFYINKDAIGGFISGKYWSSSEGSVSYSAWCQDFSTGFEILDAKNNTYNVRGAKKIYLNACAPIVTTSAISSRTSERVVAGGNVMYYTGSLITSSGICWSTNQNPTTADSKTTDGSVIGSYTSSMTGLVYGQTYYVRAYATNSVGIGYGEQVSFTYSFPLLTTIVASSITQNSAITGGDISIDGGQNVTAHGVCWSTSPNPTTANSKTSDGAGIGTFSSSIAGLTANTTYFLRAYAITSEGTSYGNQCNFTTAPVVIPEISSSCATAIYSTSATCAGNVSSDGGAPVTVRGFCWSISQSPTILNSKTTNGTGIGLFSSSITGLTASTTYYIRAYATNSTGTAYSNECSFTTGIATIPTITLSCATSITLTSATSGGNISNDGGSSITERGVCWSTSQNPTILNSKTTNGTGTGSFIAPISGLTANTTYYLRAYATNNVGTAYSAQCSFTTTLSKPDLIVEFLTINGSKDPMTDGTPVFYNGDSSYIGFGVKNQGAGASNASNVKLFLSKDDKLDDTDIILVTQNINDITAGNDVTFGNNTITIPNILSDTSATFYYILAVVDKENQIVESDETNNVLSKKIFIYGSGNN